MHSIYDLRSAKWDTLIFWHRAESHNRKKSLYACLFDCRKFIELFNGLWLLNDLSFAFCFANFSFECQESMNVFIWYNWTAVEVIKGFDATKSITSIEICQIVIKSMIVSIKWISQSNQFVIPFDILQQNCMVFLGQLNICHIVSPLLSYNSILKSLHCLFSLSF